MNDLDKKNLINDACLKGDMNAVLSLIKTKADVNNIYEDRTPLMEACSNRHQDIVSTLLENGANITLVNSDKWTALHYATKRLNNNNIVKILLEHVNRYDVIDFVNAKSITGKTALHIAASSNNLEIIKTLLKNGAIYNIKGFEKKCPVALTRNGSILYFFNLIEELFHCKESCNIEVVNKLKSVSVESYFAIANARNEKGQTILQVAKANNNKLLKDELLKMRVEPGFLHLNIEQLEDLKTNASLIMESDFLYLLGKHSGPNNFAPWKTLKDGSSYLNLVVNLVQMYRLYIPGPIDNKDIRDINNLLNYLEYDPKHVYVTDKKTGSVSTAEDSKYFKLLNSVYKKGINLFLTRVQDEVEIPLESFYNSINLRLRSVYSEILVQACRSNNKVGVENLIQKIVSLNIKMERLNYKNIYNDNPALVGAIEKYRDIGTNYSKVNLLLQYAGNNELHCVINAKTDDGMTPLHIAAEEGFSDIVKLLLKNGAVYNIMNNNGKTPADLAANGLLKHLFAQLNKTFEEVKNKVVSVIDELRAASDEYFSIVKNVRNIQGKTLLDLAIDKNFEGLIKLLMNGQ